MWCPTPLPAWVSPWPACADACWVHRQSMLGTAQVGAQTPTDGTSMRTFSEFQVSDMRRPNSTDGVPALR